MNLKKKRSEITHLKQLTFFYILNQKIQSSHDSKNNINLKKLLSQLPYTNITIILTSI